MITKVRLSLLGFFGLDTKLKLVSVITFLRTIVLKLSARLLLARLATSSTFSDCKVHVSVPICLCHESKSL